MDEEFKHDRVTAIISPFTGIEFVPEMYLEKAAARGTEVHKHIEGLVMGFEAYNIDEKIAPYLRSFKRYWADSKHSFDTGDIIQEERLFCDSCMITGKPDLIVKFEDRTLVLDWKTSAREHPTSWAAQGAAYKYLLEVNGYENVDPVVFVKVSKYGGPPKLFQYKDYKGDLEVFQKCLDLYRHFEMDKTRNKFK